MSRRFSVCNGDADGLCAAVQWVMHEPGPVELVTGLKRQRALLHRVRAQAGDEVNVFDIALAPNSEALRRLIGDGARIRYFDHHTLLGDLPKAPLFEAHVDVAADTCTSLMVDRRIGGACPGWALVGAYGDNVVATADRLGALWGFGAEDRRSLRRLGSLINYNAYGDDEADVRMPPAALYEVMARYRDPLELVVSESIVDEIDGLRRDDLRQARNVGRYRQGAHGNVHMLPDAPWSRRVSGTLANELANGDPAHAHAVVCERPGGYLISVRSPLAVPFGADVLCRRFGGGGRGAAAGVDHLPADQLERFIAAFSGTDWSAAAGLPPPVAVAQTGAAQAALP